MTINIKNKPKVTKIRRISAMNPYTKKRHHRVYLQGKEVFNQTLLKEFSTAEQADLFISEYAKEHRLEIIPHCGGYTYLN